VLVLTIVGTLNLLRSPTGRAFVAIRDSETAARSMGINVSLYKVKVIRDQRGHYRIRRRPVRTQAVFHQPRNVHPPALDRVHHRDPDRRHFQLARRGARAIFLVMIDRS